MAPRFGATRQPLLSAFIQVTLEGHLGDSDRMALIGARKLRRFALPSELPTGLLSLKVRTAGERRLVLVAARSEPVVAVCDATAGACRSLVPAGRVIRRWTDGNASATVIVVPASGRVAASLSASGVSFWRTVRLTEGPTAYLTR